MSDYEDDHDDDEYSKGWRKVPPGIVVEFENPEEVPFWWEIE